MFILIYALVRFSVPFVAILSQNVRQFAEYDYVVYLGITYRQYYDIYMIFLVLFLELFIFVNASIYYGLPANCYTVGWFYQMVVLGEDAFLDSQYSHSKIDKLRAKDAAKLDSHLEETWPRGRAIVPVKYRNKLTLFFAKLTLWYSIGTVDRKFALKHQILPNLNAPVKLRMKVTQRLPLVDKLFCFAQLYAIIFTILSMAIVYRQVRGGMPFYGPVLFLVDYSLIFYQVYQLMFIAYFSVVSIQSSSFIGISLAKVRTKALQGALKSARKQSNAFHREVARFLVEYHQICEFPLRGNVEIAGPLFFAFLLTNVPANVYCIQRLTQKGNSLEIMAVLGLIMSIQVMGTWTVMGPMAKFASAVEAPTQVLIAVQARLNPRQLSLKLKLEQLYGTLLSGSIAATVGPLNTVTYGYILEFLYTYTSLLFMAFGEEATLNDLVEY